MSQSYMAILNLEENEMDIRNLTSFRPIATIPFAGRYRIIDFMLSNIVNAGITKAGIFTNKTTRSLTDHLGNGKPWDLSRKIGGLYIFDHSLLGYDKFDVKMFGNNMEFLHKSMADSVIISSSYMIYNINLKKVIEAHENSVNDVTFVYTKTDCADTEFMNCAVLNFDSTGKIVGIGKNLGMHKHANICTELFIMKKEILLKLIYKSMKTGNAKTFNDYLYSQIDEINMGAYEFEGNIKCINSVQAYFNAHIEIIKNKNLRDGWFKNADMIYTKTKDSPPSLYSASAIAVNSIVADGCRIEGNIRNCVLSRFVKIGKGAKLENCIIFPGTSIGEGAQLSNVIVEKNNTVNPYTQIVGTRDFPIVIEHKNTGTVFEAAAVRKSFK